ncbi:MAG: uracil phosphoribosyltransferase [Flavobacteriales bacterium CG03_land_8_20_14_0_80_35_15]|nr:uracil phosphoribosyltransferase [Zetaproteobacteria bacterium]PIR13920.1 MAG: uracil phosphoribosyltransferase [Flavobacteriales bacterium CG11_big_fil_rev_8_21_14_0_20_35_7]PIV17503.1 MAG: uracil phosphoribosyltransferase [Flavobacteriales bacterium CG03_land_8_20_14_0_80_35_15]PIX05954.1 MAG: uracil phosphoribosyltransferase [Flavobacteriales bacterium CG_4_8_14_3_um_filter_35_10]PJA06270.1 MAG: uracil phosphoribosyltransferase [Flavobacteriales bacterium CG_4_10_14_0_2_um_filter_35_18]
MTIHNLDTQNSILLKFISEIRDANIQKDKLRFRRNIERIGELLGYELSKELIYQNQSIKTPLGTKVVPLFKNDLVICSILRAGLPLHQGLLNYFDDAENAFISAYRKHLNHTDKFEIVVEYLASPSLENKTLLLADPMLATGRSMVSVYEDLKKLGTPKQIHIISVIGALEGINYIKDKFPKNTHLWIATVDDTLNAKGYIVPGLGDAGDLSYGLKL